MGNIDGPCHHHSNDGAKYPKKNKEPNVQCLHIACVNIFFFLLVMNKCFFFFYSSRRFISFCVDDVSGPKKKKIVLVLCLCLFVIFVVVVFFVFCCSNIYFIFSPRFIWFHFEDEHFSFLFLPINNVTWFLIEYNVCVCGKERERVKENHNFKSWFNQPNRNLVSFLFRYCSKKFLFLTFLFLWYSGCARITHCWIFFFGYYYYHHCYILWMFVSEWLIITH